MGKYVVYIIFHIEKKNMSINVNLSIKNVNLFPFNLTISLFIISIATFDLFLEQNSLPSLNSCYYISSPIPLT